MSSEVGASSFMSDMSVRDALNEQPAPAAAPPLVVEIERDTVEDEDTLLGGLEIIPPSSFWTDNKQASFAVNNRLLKSWLKQPSPCCAAASVAGSWNALCDMGRRSADAVTIQNVLDIYIALVQAQVERLSGSFRRKLGGSGDFDAFVADIEREAITILEMQQKNALPNGSSRKTKTKKLTKKMVIKAANKVIETFLATYGNPGSLDASSSRPISEESASDLSLQFTPPYALCLHEFIQSQMASSAEKSGEGGQEAENEADDDEEEEEEEEGSDNEDEKGEGGTASVDREPRSVALGSVSMSETPRYGAPAQQTHGQVPLEALDSALSKLTANAERLLPVIAKKGVAEVMEISASSKSAKAGGLKAKKTHVSKATAKKSDAKLWNWVGDLRGILHKRLGLYRLQNKECPSTTIIGNWGILEAAPLLSEAHGLGSSGFTAALFMGKKLKGGRVVEYPVSGSDDKATITKQWSALCAAFQREDCILLYHLKNHYAPIYAVKEWSERDVSSGSTATSVTYRQVLTARKGQRPTTWIDFDEVRCTLLSWDGYKIMLLSRGADVASADMRQCTVNTKRSAVHCYVDTKG